MKCFKITFCIFFIIFLCHGVWGFTQNLNSKVSGQQEHGEHREMEKDVESLKIPKVNWKPVCVERVEMHVTESIPMDQIANTPPKFPNTQRSESSGNVCEPPNGLGLKNLIQQANTLLPHAKLQSIVLSSLRDPQVHALRELLTSSTFHDKVIIAAASRNFIILRDYICRALNLDIKFYLEFVRTLVQIEKAQLSDSLPADNTFQGRTGIRGLLLDLHDALPKQQLQDSYQRLLESDDQLVLAVKRMKSPDFYQLLDNLKNVPEIKEIVGMLREVGVPLHEFKELIDIALGWQGSEEFEESNFDIKI